MLGMALDPNFTTGRTSTRSTPTTRPRSARSRAGPTAARRRRARPADGCVVSGRLSRLTAGGVEQVLIEDLCQQYPSHSIGSLAFGADGALYVSAGDGASFNFADYGQDGNPVNPCGDPPGGVGGAMTPPTAEGGALRSQDVRTTGRPDRARRRDPARQPRHRRGVPDNPNAGEPGPERAPDRRPRPPQPVPHHDPARDERGLVGDVGWNTWEEINRAPNPTGPIAQLRLAVLRGRRAPGRLRQPQPEPLRDALRAGRRRARGAVLHVQPRRAGRRRRDLPDRRLVDLRPRLLHRAAASRPAYDGALFFSDYSRNCIWVMLPRRERAARPGDAADVRRRRRRAGRAPGRPRAATSTTSTWAAARSAASAGLLQRRADGRRRPRRRPAAPLPLTVNFNGRGSTDPDGDDAHLRLGPRRRRRSSTTRRPPRRAAPTPHAGVVHRAAARHGPGGLTDTTTSASPPARRRT